MHKLRCDITRCCPCCRSTDPKQNHNNVPVEKSEGVPLNVRETEDGPVSTIQSVSNHVQVEKVAEVEMAILTRNLNDVLIAVNHSYVNTGLADDVRLWMIKMVESSSDVGDKWTMFMSRQLSKIFIDAIPSVDAVFEFGDQLCQARYDFDQANKEEKESDDGGKVSMLTENDRRLRREATNFQTYSRG